MTYESPESTRHEAPHRSVYSASRRKLFRRGATLHAPGRTRRYVEPSADGAETSTDGTVTRTVYSARRARRWPRRVAFGILGLVALLTLLCVAGYFYVDSTLQGIPRVAVGALTPAKAGQPLDVLLVGSDSRSCVKGEEASEAYGDSATVSGQRADTIMLARFLSGGRVELLSIPRDTWVPISGTGGSAKINAAFNSGPNDLVATIQKNFGLPVNHVMMTTFCGLPAMVNSLGGVYMRFPDEVRDAYSGLDVRTTGCQLVDGTEALALVRSRHLYYYSHGQWNYDGMSDFSRIQRQQGFFHALLKRVHQVVPNVFRLNAFLGAVARGVVVDDKLTSDQIISLGLHYHSLSQADLSTSLLPTTESVIDGEDVLLPAPTEDKTLIDAFLAGNTKTFSTALGPSPRVPSSLRAKRASLADSQVVVGHLNEPWNPTPC